MHILILGGTLPGLHAAAAFRDQGHRVTLAVSSSFLGEDVCGTSRFLPSTQQEAGLTALNGALAALGAPALEGPLLWGKAKKALVTAATARSIGLLYMARLAGVELAQGRVCAAHLAGKQGLTRIPCDALVDATLYAEPSRQLAGQPGRVRQGAAIGTYLEYRGVPDAAPHTRLDCGELMAGCVAKDHAFLRVSLAAPQDLSIPQARRLLTLRSLEAARAFHAAVPEAELQQVLDPFADLALCAPPAPEVSGFFRASAGVSGQVMALGAAPAQGALRLLTRPQATQEAQLLVAGGGTAGVWAAFSAAREGMRVCMLELFSQLGGTRTIGGVFPLYGGNRNGLFEQLWREILACQQSVGGKAGEALLYASLAQELGVAVHAPCVLFGAACEGKRVARVRCVDEEGVFDIVPGQAIDATGDGDLAAFAGVPFAFGDSQAGFTQNYSQMHRHSGTAHDKRVADQDVMDQTLASEWTRAITYNTANCADYDIVEMLTVREGRRIRGKDSVRMRDILRGRRPADAIYDALSDYDPHARCFTDLARLGVLPQHAPCRFACVPYGSLLPEALVNLLVVGKALSADQDGFNHLRMCPDVMSIGWIAGYAAAKAWRDGCGLPDVDLTALRRMLYEKGALLQPPDGQESFSNTAQRIKARLLAGDEAAFADAVWTDWPQLPDLLEQARAAGIVTRSLLVEKTLLHFGRKADTGLLIRELEALNEKLGEVEHSDYAGGTQVLGGIMDRPDDYWRVNQLSVLLAAAGCTEAVPVLERVFAYTTRLGADWREHASAYTLLRIDHHTVGNYDRMLCLAHAASVLPDARFAPHLMRLHGLLSCPQAEPDNFYMACLDCMLLKAAKACGAERAEDALAGHAGSRYASLRRLAQS